MADRTGSTDQDIFNEPDWGSTHGHRVGLRDKNDRYPGMTHSGDDWRWEIEKEAEEKIEELKEMAAKGNLLTVRDYMNKQEDLHLRRPDVHPKSWRYVLHTTENHIKEEQDWFINQKKREEQQRQRQRQQQQPQQQEKQEQQQPSGDEQADSAEGDKMQTDDSDQDSGNNYSPEDQMFLQSLREEQKYISNLAMNDGQGRSPVDAPLYPEEIDETDQFTPDNWIARSDRLIRLTGKHPMNAEPKLTEVYDAGFITPNQLHYVRNHGAVPHILWERHRIAVSAGKSISLSMDDVSEQFRSINIPIFLACDGNRRKELNMIRQSKGFNFGAAAVGCAYWKGALLRDILIAANVGQMIQQYPTQRLWVHFEGADELSNGNYGTSLPLDYAMDHCHDVMLAYAMNDFPLPPDHGYPIRLMIPGYVGGRCVKWLSKVWVTDHESDNYHHIYDNRVLPSYLTDKDSEFADILYHHPSTLINDQTLNSVIVKPSHGEKFALQDMTKGKTYRIEGFAYNGSGDEIQSVEISLDEGANWIYCFRRYPEAPLRHGRKFWTWLHWHVDIDMTRLLRAVSISVRCYDVKKSHQPRDPTWNIEGMMNNSWYTVKPEVREDLQGNQTHLIFRHPCEPGTGQGGWKKPSMEIQMQDVRRQASAPAKQFTRAEIEKHSTEKDCWIVVNGRVYDATSVLSWHPGGKAAIMPHAGKVHTDTSDEYESIHDEYAHEKLEECVLGVVTKKCMEYMKKIAEDKAKLLAQRAASAKDVALKENKWTRVRLVGKSQLSQDTHRFTFSLPPPAKKLGMETGQHLQIGFHFKDRMVIRPYTPTRPLTESEDDGTFDLTVKTYYPDPSQPGGTLSNVLDCLQPGEEVEVKGPSGEIQYRGCGHFVIDDQDRYFERITLILGGSGITPGYQLIAKILLKANEDKTKIKVIDSNKTANDILMRGELAEFEKKHPDQFQVCHVLSHPGQDWSGEKGHVDERIIRQYSYPPEDKNVALLCGPPTMIQKSVLPALMDWGYHEDNNLFGF